MTLAAVEFLMNQKKRDLGWSLKNILVRIRGLKFDPNRFLWAVCYIYSLPISSLAIAIPASPVKPKIMYISNMI